MNFEDLEKGLLNPNFNFREIEDWSSMHALVIIALIDSEYDVLLNGGDLKGAETVQDLFDMIKKSCLKWLFWRYRMWEFLEFLALFQSGFIITWITIGSLKRIEKCLLKQPE